jgi:hypothetical protein
MKHFSLIFALFGIFILFMIYFLFPITLSGKVEKQTNSIILLNNVTIYCEKCPNIKDKFIEAKIIRNEYYGRFDILTLKSKDFNTP